jgi:hypothetical protein
LQPNCDKKRLREITEIAKGAKFINVTYLKNGPFDRASDNVNHPDMYYLTKNRTPEKRNGMNISGTFTRDIRLLKK